MTPSHRAPLTRLAVRATLWTGVSHYLLAILGLAKTVILARVVALEYFGLLAGAVVWASYLGFARLDLRAAVLGSNEEPDVLSAQFLLENLSAFCGLVLAAGLAMAWPSLATPRVWLLIFAILALMQFEALTSTSAYLAEKRLRHDVLARLSILSTVVGFPVSVGLALHGFPLTALLLDGVLPILITRLGAFLHVRWRPRLAWNGRRLREQLHLGWTLWSTGLLGKVAYEFGDWLVFNLNRPHPVVWLGAGVEPEALYARAYRVGKLPMDLAAGMIGATALALYAEGAARGHEILVELRRRLTWALAWVIFPAGSVAFVTADELVHVLGDQWVPMVPLFRLMIVFVFSRPLVQNNGHLLLATDRARDFRRAMLAQALVILAVCPVAVSFFGAAGAAGVVSVMSLVGFLFSERQVARLLGCSPWQPYLVPGGGALAVLVLVPLLEPMLPGNIWLAAAAEATMGLLVFGGALWLFEWSAALDAWRLIRGARRPT